MHKQTATLQLKSKKQTWNNIETMRSRPNKSQWYTKKTHKGINLQIWQIFTQHPYLPLTNTTVFIPKKWSNYWHTKIDQFSLIIHLKNVLILEWCHTANEMEINPAFPSEPILN